MSNIIVVPPNILTAQQKKTISAKGYLLIETDDPDKVRVISPTSSVEANDLTMAALHALANSSLAEHKIFVTNLYSRLKKAEDQPELSRQP